MNRSGIGNYEHIVSLGWFCGPAQELETVGLRDGSYPFDWGLSCSFEKIIELIENKFNGLQDVFDETKLYQYEKSRNCYYSPLIDFHFFHDFDAYKPLKNQLPKVLDKYVRRANRFMEISKSPTLFVRYIYNDDELEWIVQNLDRIKHTIKGLCADSALVLIYDGLLSSLILEHLDWCWIFRTTKDEGDTVSRHFLHKLESEGINLKKKLINAYNKDKYYANIKIYERKKRESKMRDYFKAVQRRIDYRKKYCHSQFYIE